MIGARGKEIRTGVFVSFTARVYLVTTERFCQTIQMRIAEARQFAILIERRLLYLR